MKFEIKRDKSRDIEVFQFELEKPDKPSIWQHWKLIGGIAAASFLLALLMSAILCKDNLDGMSVKVHKERTTVVTLENANEQKGNGQGADGTAASLHRAAESLEGKN